MNPWRAAKEYVTMRYRWYRWAIAMPVPGKYPDRASFRIDRDRWMAKQPPCPPGIEFIPEP
jgi:hypothetical protein